jgi:hypothetical protein
MAIPENNLSNLPVYGSEEWEQKNAADEAARPQVLPLNKRKWPCGLPDRMQPGSNF